MYMQADKVLKKFFWVAFGVFLLASIPHVAYFFRAFEPGDNSLWWWIVAYAIAISVDITIFLLSLSVAEMRRRNVETWLVVSVWLFIVGLAALSWYINWQYAVQFASNMLSKPSSYKYVGMINPIIASCFQALAIAYTWISDKIGQADMQEILQPAQPTARTEIAEIARNLPEIAEISSARPDSEILQFLAENPTMKGKDIAAQFHTSESRISRLKKTSKGA
jgi:hypothetical protein